MRLTLSDNFLISEQVCFKRDRGGSPFNSIQGAPEKTVRRLVGGTLWSFKPSRSSKTGINNQPNESTCAISC